MQRGSDDILIGSGAGAVPMKFTLPVTAPAVAGSTGFVTGAAGAEVADLSLPPPQAAAASATDATKSARNFEPILMQGRSEPPPEAGKPTLSRVRRNASVDWTS